MPNNIYMLWDESHLWGLMLLRALRFWELPVKTVSAEQIAAGILQKDPPRTLFVPGGWARLKSQALSASGHCAIHKYVRNGGTYIGFCGGAGLALSSTRKDGFLSLCPCGRKPVRNRLPNFSGYMHCRLEMDNTQEKIMLPVWWPSQFKMAPDPDLSVLCTYSRPSEDFWVSDLKMQHIPREHLKEWERIYGINLDPDILKNEPCIIQGRFGKGKYLLSYAHLETPLAAEANRLLLRFLSDQGINFPGTAQTVPEWDIFNPEIAWDDPTLVEAREGLLSLIKAGREHFLIISRSTWLLGWRRGIPGSAINFLLAMLSEILATKPNDNAHKFLQKRKNDFRTTMNKFINEMREYILSERMVLASRPSSPEASGDKQLQARKNKLTGKFPGYGGLYAELLNDLDGLLWRLIQQE
ncbi:MAG: BPL-N domain-containing protein [Desulfovibrionales bacterium]